MTDTATATAATGATAPWTPASPLGDPVPAAVTAFYAAIDAGRFAAAASTFASDGCYAAPLPGEIETGPRTVTVGRVALRASFEARGRNPWGHRVLLCVVRDGDVLVEGVLLNGAGTPTATFVASARVGADGLLERYLAFSCADTRDPIPTAVDAATVPADAATVLHRYFEALDQGRFTDAAACFSDDVLYSHPPYRHTGIDDPGRVEFRGRVALRAAFDQRGRTSFSHQILTCIQQGPHCLLEGLVDDLPGGGTGSFVSSLSLAADGTIRRYVSFFCEPGVSIR